MIGETDKNVIECEYDRTDEFPARHFPKELESFERNNFSKANFRDKAKTDEPSPDNQIDVHVVPNSDKRENHPHIKQHIFSPSKRNVEVSNQPLVETSMPTPPKHLESKIVHDASIHVLWTFDSIP